MEEALDYIMNYSFIFLEYCGCISCAVNKQSIRFAKINFCICEHSGKLRNHTTFKTSQNGTKKSRFF